jgi:hypothetical protein
MKDKSVLFNDVIRWGYTASVADEWMRMEQLWNDTDRGN